MSEPLYIQQERERISKMSNRELFDEFLYAQVPDGYEGEFTTRGGNLSDLYLECLKERMKDWLAS